MGWNKRRRDIIRGNGNRGIKSEVQENQKILDLNMIEPEIDVLEQDSVFEHDEAFVQEDELDKDAFNKIFGTIEADKEMEKFEDMSYDNYLGSQEEDFDCDCEYEDDYEIDRD